MPSSGGPITRVTKRGGWAPLESIDGQYLFYAKPAEGSLWRVSLAGGEEVQVLTNVATRGSSYAPAREGIYFIRTNSHATEQELAFFRFATGEISPIASIPPTAGLGLALSPDERLLLYSHIAQAGSDLMLVQNFHSEAGFEHRW
jgi:hypothetical protein